MKKKDKVSLLSGIIFFVLGLIIFLNPYIVVTFVSYALGAFLIALGIYKTTNYCIQDKRYGIVNKNEIAFGISAIILGILFIFLAGAIELLLRFIVGFWLIISGINKIIITFYTNERNSKFYTLIVVGCILILTGVYIILVSNLALSIIGLFMMIYGIIDFISYFITPDNEVMKKSKKEKIEEVEFEEKKDK